MTRATRGLLIAAAFAIGGLVAWSSRPGPRATPSVADHEHQGGTGERRGSGVSAPLVSLAPVSAGDHPGARPDTARSAAASESGSFRAEEAGFDFSDPGRDEGWAAPMERTLVDVVAAGFAEHQPYVEVRSASCLSRTCELVLGAPADKVDVVRDAMPFVVFADGVVMRPGSSVTGERAEVTVRLLFEAFEQPRLTAAAFAQAQVDAARAYPTIRERYQRFLAHAEAEAP